jgi:hypothetical protein
MKDETFEFEIPSRGYVVQQMISQAIDFVFIFQTNFFIVCCCCCCCCEGTLWSRLG